MRQGAGSWAREAIGKETGARLKGTSSSFFLLLSSFIFLALLLLSFIRRLCQEVEFAEPTGLGAQQHARQRVGGWGSGGDTGDDNNTG